MTQRHRHHHHRDVGGGRRRHHPRRTSSARWTSRARDGGGDGAAWARGKARGDRVERWRDETTGSVDEATSSDEYADAIRELTLMHACEAWALRLFGPAAIDSELQRLASEL